MGLNLNNLMISLKTTYITRLGLADGFTGGTESLPYLLPYLAIVFIVAIIAESANI